MFYESKNISVIYQGGESIIGDQAVSDLLFNSRANYDQALGKSHVMQGSCNVTGMGRILEPLRDAFGDKSVFSNKAKVFLMVIKWLNVVTYEQTKRETPHVKRQLWFSVLYSAD